MSDSEGMHVLPGNPYQRFLLPLDHLPSRQHMPRWGFSRPTHPGLLAILARRADVYRDVLRGTRALKPLLSAIRGEFTNEGIPEPGWLGGPITPLDLALLYYFISTYRPRTYVEIGLGSGCTTCMARRAIDDHKLGTRIVSIDPEPRAGIDSICDEIFSDGLETLASLEVFENLVPGDIVFVDGSHRAFMNSDVTVFILDVLPRLRPGVLVQFHDVFLPYDYPDMFKDWYWNEQYLLAAYLLAADDRIQILMPSYFVSMSPGLSESLRPPILDIAGYATDWFFGGSLWLTQTERLRNSRGSGSVSRISALPELIASGLRDRTRVRHSERPRFSVITNKPIAYDSPDHILPWGTMRDNSVSPSFTAKLARWMPRTELSVLDLGCAGGGFVKSIIDVGCVGIGVEGSDYSKQRKRAEWATIPEYLFTADVTEPFAVVVPDRGDRWRRMRFAVITAWEVMEHIRTDKLPVVFQNIADSLREDGVVIMSVSPNEEVIEGVTLHQTVKEKDWWIAECRRNGFVHHDEVLAYFGEDWVRSAPNAPASFHLVLTRAARKLPFAGNLRVTSDIADARTP